MRAFTLPRPLLAASLVLSVFGFAAPGHAQPTPASPEPYVAPTANPLSYDDPGMHFQPPDDWKRVPVPPAPEADSSGQRPPVAIYEKNPSRSDARLIVIAIQAFDGPLDQLEINHENELRKNQDSIYFAEREKKTLANGMPAYWLKADSGTEAGKYARRYEWVVADTQRSIIVSLVGRQGDFDDAEAIKALSSLYVVVYPGRRN